MTSSARPLRTAGRSGGQALSGVCAAKSVRERCPTDADRGGRNPPVCFDGDAGCRSGATVAGEDGLVAFQRGRGDYRVPVPDARSVTLGLRHPFTEQPPGGPENVGSHVRHRGRPERGVHRPPLFASGHYLPDADVQPQDSHPRARVSQRSQRPASRRSRSLIRRSSAAARSRGLRTDAAKPMHDGEGTAASTSGRGAGPSRRTLFGRLAPFDRS